MAAGVERLPFARTQLELVNEWTKEREPVRGVPGHLFGTRNVRARREVAHRAVDRIEDIRPMIESLIRDIKVFLGEIGPRDRDGRKLQDVINELHQYPLQGIDVGVPDDLCKSLVTLQLAEILAKINRLGKAQAIGKVDRIRARLNINEDCEGWIPKDNVVNLAEGLVKFAPQHVIFKAGAWPADDDGLKNWYAQVESGEAIDFSFAENYLEYANYLFSFDCLHIILKTLAGEVKDLKHRALILYTLVKYLLAEGEQVDEIARLAIAIPDKKMQAMAFIALAKQNEEDDKRELK